MSIVSTPKSAAQQAPVALPQDIPVFPLAGVLLLPRGQLPLNIFEPRYLAMFDDSLRTHRMIGVIQPRDFSTGLVSDAAPDRAELFQTGCAGRITAFEETDDGRYLVTLTGVSRFHLTEELPLTNGYRRARVSWAPFAADLAAPEGLDIDRLHLKELLRSYFTIEGLSCNWDSIDGASDDKLITALSMICPLEPSEKQALLEAACCRSRAQMFMTMLEMAVHNDKGGCECSNRH
ncbi:MAG TPA: LON peptidase substrate-binding domain-containing protein [Micavibrio sp.]